jgi:hypothetical protein
MRALARLVRLVVGLVVAIFLALGIGLALLALFQPQEARLVVAAVAASFLNHHSPPPIAAGLVPGGSDWMMLEPTSSKFTAALRQHFPMGSDADALHDTLQAQGFGDEAWLRPGALCTPPDDEPSPTMRLIHCPPAPWQHSLHYFWGGVICQQDLTVLWSTGARRRISQVAGYYSATCL